MLLEQAEKADEIYISSFSLYAGVNSDGTDSKYDNDVKDLLDGLAKLDKKVNIVVGRPDLISCTKGCKHCADKYASWLVRYRHHEKKWPSFNWHLNYRSHAKFAIFKPTNMVIMGGSNLSNSGLFDVNVVFEDETIVSRLLAAFHELTIKSGYVLKFGKHKHKPITQIPIDYLRWMVDSDMEDEIKNHARHEIERRSAHQI